MPPSKQVSGDAVVDVLADLLHEAEKPYATTTDIAEGLDVTAQTIRNNASEIAEDPRIKKGKVGQSSVYWLAVKYDPEELNGASEHETPASDISGEQSTEPSGEPVQEFEKPENEPETQPPSRTERLEMYANRRTVIGGGVLAALAMVLMPLSGTLVANGALMPGMVLLGLATLTLLLAAGTIGVAVVAQLLLARPLKGLVLDVDPDPEVKV